MKRVFYLKIEGHNSIISTSFNQKNEVTPEQATAWGDKKFWEAMKTSPLPYYPAATVVVLSEDESEFAAYTRPQDSNMAGHLVWQQPVNQSVINEVIEYHAKQAN